MGLVQAQAMALYVPVDQPGQLITGIICQVDHQYLRLNTGDIYRATAVFGKALQMELDTTGSQNAKWHDKASEVPGSGACSRQNGKV